MSTVLSASGELARTGAGRLLDQLADDRGLSPIDLDLTGVTFVTPFAAASIAAALHGWPAPPDGVRLLCPSDSNCKRYLAASGFLQSIAEVIDVIGDDGLSDVKPSWGATTVLPLSRIEDCSRIPELLDMIEERLDLMLGRSGEGWTNTKRPIVSTIREICQNIFDHADFPHGWLAAQQYRNQWNGRPYVEVGIADAGRGIRRSLATRHVEVLHATDGEAVERALGGLSRMENTYRGTGYFILQKATKDLDGSFYLRSGAGAIAQNRRGAARREEELPAWRGTYLHLRLTCA